MAGYMSRAGHCRQSRAWCKQEATCSHWIDLPLSILPTQQKGRGLRRRIPVSWLHNKGWIVTKDLVPYKGIVIRVLFC